MKLYITSLDKQTIERVSALLDGKHKIVGIPAFIVLRRGGAYTPCRLQLLSTEDLTALWPTIILATLARSTARCQSFML